MRRGERIGGFVRSPGGYERALDMRLADGVGDVVGIATAGLLGSTLPRGLADRAFSAPAGLAISSALKAGERHALAMNLPNTVSV